MACTLTLTLVRIDPPTAAGSWGQLTYRLGGTLDNYQYLKLARASDGEVVNARTGDGDGEYLLAVPPAGIGTPLRLAAYEDAVATADTCSAEVTFTVPAYTEAIDPSLGQPSPWQPVGGVLPNPVALPIEATRTDASGAPRAGLFAEVELWALGATVAFASFRATVRTASQAVDAAPYLRAQLRAALSYASPLGQPLLDASASLAYTYRYRISDRSSAGAWVPRAGVRYAVLAALPLAADTMQPYLADGAGRVASVFPSGEAVQFGSYPLEVSVLLPPFTVPRWAEYRYLSASGQEVEIRSLALGPELPAGLLRLPLPADVPLLADSVEVAVVDTDRHFQSPGPHLPAPAPTSTQGTYADPFYGLY